MCVCVREYDKDDTRFGRLAVLRRFLGNGIQRGEVRVNEAACSPHCDPVGTKKTVRRVPRFWEEHPTHIDRTAFFGLEFYILRCIQEGNEEEHIVE